MEQEELDRLNDELLAYEDINEMKHLLEAGADVNAQTEYGETALMEAKNAEQTKLLLEAGADVNARDEDGRGRTALTYAKDAEQTKLLREAEQKSARTAKIASMRKRLADGKALGTKSEAVENPDKIKKPEGKISMCINKSNER